MTENKTVEFVPPQAQLEDWLNTWKPATAHQRAVTVFLRRRSTLASKQGALSALGAVARACGYESALSAPWLDMGFEELDQARDVMLRRGKQASSVNTCMAVVKGFYKAAHKARLVDAARLESVREIDRVKEEGDDVRRVLTDDEFRRLLAACAADQSVEGRRDHTILVVFWCTGLRVGSMSSLTVEDVTLDGIEGACLRVMGKGNKRRTLPISDDAADTLRDWLVWRGRSAGPLFPACVGSGRKISLALHRTMTSNGYRHMLENRSQQAGVAAVSTHTFRRTFCTRLYDDGVADSSIQWLMMHADIATTLRYNQRQREQASAVVRGRSFLPEDKTGAS